MDQFQSQSSTPQTSNPQLFGVPSITPIQSNLQNGAGNSYLQNNSSQKGVSLKVVSSCSGNCSGSVTQLKPLNQASNYGWWLAGLVMLIVAVMLIANFISPKEAISSGQKKKK